MDPFEIVIPAKVTNKSFQINVIDGPNGQETTVKLNLQAQGQLGGVVVHSVAGVDQNAFSFGDDVEIIIRKK